MSIETTKTKILNLITNATEKNSITPAILGGLLSECLALTRPYKVYSCLISQSGTNPPVATVLENTLGGDIVWSRDGDVAGHYTGTLPGAFKKPVFFLSNLYGSSSALLKIDLQRINNDSIMMWTKTGSSYSDNLLFEKTSLEIRIYD